MSVQRRGNRYSSRVSVPSALRPLVRREEVLRSLHTEDPAEARLRAQQWEAHLATLFGHLRRNASTMAPDQIDALVDQYLRTEIAEVEERLALDEWRAGGNDWHAMAQHLLAERAEEIEGALAENDLRRTIEEARSMLPGGDDRAVRVLARRLLEVQLKATLAELRAFNGKPLPRVGPAVKPKHTGPLLSVVMQKYIASQLEAKAWAPKTEKSVRGILAALLDMIGDRPIGTITKADMSALQTLLARVPSHAVKRYPGMTLRQAADAADATGSAERLSAKSKNIYVTWARTLWKWALKFDHATENPTVVLAEFNEEDERDQRDRFTDEQIAALMKQIEPERETAPAHWWIPRVMLYSGLRLEEAAKLRPCDIVKREGVYCFDINQEAGRLKRKEAARVVPIHSAMLPHVLKLKAEVTRRGGEKANLWGLTPDKHGRWSELLSKRLNGRLDAAGIDARGLVMESARNTFGAKLRAAGVDLYTIAELYGHSSKSDVRLAMTKRYVGREELHRMRDAVEKLTLGITF
jgi:integrase